MGYLEHDVGLLQDLCPHTTTQNLESSGFSLQAAVAVSSSKKQPVAYMRSLACCVRLALLYGTQNALLLYELQPSGNRNTQICCKEKYDQQVTLFIATEEVWI